MPTKDFQVDIGEISLPNQITAIFQHTHTRERKKPIILINEVVHHLYFAHLMHLFTQEETENEWEEKTDA